jgi:hypothetical protein
MTIEEFLFEQRRRLRKKLPDNVVELFVLAGLHNVSDHVLKVERRKGAEVLETVYER